MKRQTAPPPPLLTVAAAADVLNVSVKTVRRLIDRGDLRPLRIGRALRVSAEDLTLYLHRIRS